VLVATGHVTHVAAAAAAAAWGRRLLSLQLLSLADVTVMTTAPLSESSLTHLGDRTVNTGETPY